MAIDQLLRDIIFDYTLRTVVVGSALLGMVGGVLGCFAVLRRQSLVGDAVSHAALPGIVLAFIITGSKAPLILLVGAALAGWLGMFLVIAILRLTALKQDAALAMILSVLFGLGLVLLTYVQKSPNAAQAGLEKFLFGQAATLLERDLVAMGIVGLSALAIVALLWNRFKLLSFDPDYGRSLGLPITFLDFLLTGLLVAAIAIGLQAVGVVLMSAMIIAPAAAARQWTDRLGLMVFLAALFGSLAGVTGAVLSGTISRLPTGPTIVLAASTIALFSLAFAPRRGLIWDRLRIYRRRRQLQLDSVLCDLYSLAMQHADYEHGHDTATLNATRPTRGGAERTLRELERRRLVDRLPSGRWILTTAGVDAARQVATNLQGDPSCPARR